MKSPSSNITKRNGKARKAKPSHRHRRNRVASTGEEPCERVLKNGRVRRFDLLCKDEKAEPMPRKTRDFIATMTRWNLVLNNDIPQTDRHVQGERNTTVKALGTVEKKASDAKKQTARTNIVPESKEDERPQQSPKILASRKRFNGMTTGESLSEYSARLRKESQRMAVDLAKKGNHQSEKRRAYNKKRREKVARRKRRRRGECSDSDVEDDGANGEEASQSICHLPAYWQEIVNNNGRPVSIKKKRRLRRMEKEAVTKGTFRDQVDRPPDLTVRPVLRGGKLG